MKKQDEKPFCSACAGIGWVLTDDVTKRGQLIRCPVCSGRNRQLWLFNNCGLEPNEQQLGLNDYKTEFTWPDKLNSSFNRQRKIAKKVISEAIARKTGIVTFWGDCGAGKSHALHIITAECMRRDVESFYTTTANVLEHLRSIIAARQQHENGDNRFWNRLLIVPVLCLDEVDRFNATDWAREQFFTLIDTRYRRRESHLTVFATNTDPSVSDDLNYLFSRMRDGVIVRLQGDLRGIGRR